MYWLDTAMLGLLALGAALGFWSGLLWQIARFLGLGLALAGTLLLNESAGNLLQENVLHGADPRVVQGLAYVGVFLLIWIGCFLLARLLYRFIRATDLEVYDRLLGSLLGTAKMAVLLAAFSLGVANYAHPTTREWMERSRIAPVLAEGMQSALVLLPEDSRAYLRRSLQGIRDLLSPPAEKDAA